MEKKTIKDVDLKGKTVIVRVDFNVPLDDKLNVTDNTRIKAALPTIKYILDQNAKLILMSHLGRPQGKVVDSLKMLPVGKELSRLLNKEVEVCNDCLGKNIKNKVINMKIGDILLLENLRFHPEERENDAQFSKDLASLADVYVNDAFGTAHRAHASTEGITKYLPAVAGFLMEKELEYLGKIRSNPAKPFIAIVGGSKVSSKISVLEALLEKVDVLIIAGGLAYTFCKAEGWDIGNSIFEDSFFDAAEHLIEKAKKLKIDLIIPVDHVVADKFSNDANSKVVVGNIPTGFMGMDIGPKTIELIKIRLKEAKIVLWNGPLGVFEMETFSKGTFEIAKTLTEVKAITIVGGGDVVAAINKVGVTDKITHISTGGGASIEFIEGKKLPGVEALNNK
ncbi:MAG: phosphoglycerate kinase [Spirochaetota bacterium]|nr:phosphoglycerate kinase [Spirochaetota bacterium]